MSRLPEMKRLKLEEIEPGILVVSFDRPEVMNAIDTATCEDLRDLFAPLNRNPGPWRAIIVTGTGDRAFCAGGDLKERQGMTDDQWRAQHDIIEEGAWALLNATAPTIAAVNGVAYGGGCELALCCDFIYAADTARFALPEVTRGIIPGGGGTQTLSRAVGERRAKELMMTGRPFSAEEALEWGLVNRLLPQNDLMSAALDTARAHCRQRPDCRSAGQEGGSPRPADRPDARPGDRDSRLWPHDRNRGPAGRRAGLQRKRESPTSRADRKDE